jgi:hypothetical protein
MEICASYMQYPEVFKLTSDFEEAPLLESMGFITTTERDDYILLRVNGHCLDDYGVNCFCIKNGLIGGRHA